MVPAGESSSEKPQYYNVLLIEADPTQTEIYSEMIREVAECKIDVMSEARSAMDWLGRSNYHLAVVDTTQNNSLLEQIKRLSPATSVIVISDNGSIEEAVAAIRMGAEDYLKKPFRPEAFQLSVKRGLDRKQIFGENIGASLFLNLLNSCQLISATLEQSKIYEIIQSYLARELKCPYSGVFSLHEGNPFRIDDAKLKSHEDRAMEEILDIALQVSNPLTGMHASTDFMRFVDRGQLTPGMFIFRFKCGGDSDYFCVCLSPERPASMESFESRLRLLKAQIEVTGKNIEQYMGVQHLVYVDDATGLYNLRYLNYVLDREIAQSQSSGKSFAILFVDIDKFKSVNDTHGHLVGTKILHELGEELRKLVREKDTVFRYGGDEFVAVLTSCDVGTAKTVAERIRAAIEKKEFVKSDGLNLHFTISVGVALFPEHAKAKREIIEAADHAMYTVKRTTRNSVFIAPLPGQMTDEGAKSG